MAIAGPTSSLPIITPAQASPEDTDDDAPGWLSRWARRDPVAAVALALIVVQLLWRAKIGFSGFLSFDDFQLAIQAHESKLNANYLLGHFNNHMMPGGLLYVWWVTKAFGYAYWPYVLLMLLWQAVANVALFRLLRAVVDARWGILVPLCVYLFCPLNLELTSWWVVGLNLLPMQLSMIWAMLAQTNYVRTGYKRHLVSLALALLFGLAFAEKALLIAPLVALFTVCILMRGSAGRSIWRALTRYWPSWLLLAVICGGYLYLYQLHPDPAPPKIGAFGDVLRFLGQYFGKTLIPGLFGGPWGWWYSQPPLVSPNGTLAALSVLAMLALMVYTVWRRPRAGRAWIMLVLYAGTAAGLVAVGRLGYSLGSLSGLIPRYTSDIVVVAALAIGAAMFGVHGVPNKARPEPAFLTSPAARSAKAAAATFAVLALAVGTVISTNGFNQGWSNQAGRDYLATVQAELAKAPPDTVFFEQTVPDTVMMRFAYPINKQSRFFGPLPTKPVFVQEAENPKVFDGTGHIRPVWIEPGPKLVPGPIPNCGYSIDGGKPVTLSLDGNLFEWPWGVRIAYISSGDSPVTVRIGKQSHDFIAKQGLHQIFFLIVGDSDKVEINIHNSAVHMCTNDIVVGNVVPFMF